MRRQCSPIWLAEHAEFAALIERSHCCGDVLEYFGFNRGGNNQTTIKRRCEEEGISTAHFDGRAGRLAALKKVAIPLERVLVRNSSYSRCHLKARLLATGMLRNECYICGLPPFWKDNPLTLTLDHINGVYNDSRIENLRMVCPNCDRQLATFAGRNSKARRVRNNCLGCGKVLKAKKSIRCQKCNNRLGVAVGRGRVTEWPTLPELQVEVAHSSKCAVARRLGVSETAVRKMLKRMGERSKELLPVYQEGLIGDLSTVGKETLTLLI